MADDQDKTERVRAALTAELGTAAAEPATQAWLAQYADQPGGGVVRFVQQLAKEHKLESADRKRLRMALFQAIYPEQMGSGEPSGKEAEPAAKADAGAEGDEKPSPKAPRSPGQQVCAALVTSMLGQVKAATRGNMLALMREHVRKFNALDEEFSKAFFDWDGNSDPPTPSTDDGLSALVHAAYLALCEINGPADADRLLRRCVQRVDSMAAAVEYPPNELL